MTADDIRGARTMPQLLRAITDLHAPRPAIVAADGSLTYAELARVVVRRALRLREQGVARGDRVALLLPNSADFVTVYLAILTAGAIAVPLNDQYQRSELLHFMDTCDVGVLVASPEHEELCREVLATSSAERRLVPVRELDAGVDSPLAIDAVEPAVDPGAAVMYQFSSGSTGTPKRIARTHDNVLFELNSLVDTLGLAATDRFVGVAPFSHVNGMMRSMMASLRAGACLYPVPRFDRRAVARLIEAERITVFIAVPFMFAILARGSARGAADFASLRLCVSASAPMPADANEKFRERYGRYVRQLYGSTETGTISVNLDDDVVPGLESVGTPIAGVEVMVVAEDGREAEPGATGELAVRSPAAISGYLDLEEVNRAAFRDGWFLTGDIGRIDEQGRIYLLGRKKFFINKGGYKIAPWEIEALLETHPKVEEVVVMGVPTSLGDETVAAVIVPSEACTAEEIVAHCRGVIADFKIPSRIEFRDSLPKSPAGKVRRGELLKDG